MKPDTIQFQFNDLNSYKKNYKTNYVTSRSCALSELIHWGHLLASDSDYYAIKTFDFDYGALWVDDMLFY